MAYNFAGTVDLLQKWVLIILHIFKELKGHNFANLMKVWAKSPQIMNFQLQNEMAKNNLPSSEAKKIDHYIFSEFHSVCHSNLTGSYDILKMAENISITKKTVLKKLQIIMSNSQFVYYYCVLKERFRNTTYAGISVIILL